MFHAVSQAASSPISGIMGDKYNRTHIVAAGCLLWGVMTALIGLSTSLHQASVPLAWQCRSQIPIRFHTRITLTHCTCLCTAYTHLAN